MIEETLGTRGTSESFQVVGTLNLEKEQSKTSAIGAAWISAYAFRTQFGKSSGPPAREECLADHVFINRYTLVVLSFIHTYTVG